ncbi:hypothetical protein JHK85_036981 [Glycine max]|nr:hypothetical protein JHK85_036981 [Glycine max]
MLRYRATTAGQDDVMKGYFAVLAIKGEETKRFIIGLDYLNDPAFLVLLNEAQEEYGFRQQGVLALSCRPQELQKILDAPKA